MAEKAKLTEKTGIVVFARIVNTVIDLATVIAVVHILTKTEFAVIAFLLMIHEAARNIATVGFPESIFYYFERLTQSTRKAFALQTSAILAVMGVLAGAVILAVSYFVPFFLTDWSLQSIQSVQTLLPLMALVTVLEVPTWPTTNILLALDRQKDASWYEILTSSLSFISLVGPLLLGFPLRTAIYGLAVYALVRFIGSFIWLMLKMPHRLEKKSGVTLKQQFSFSIPLGLSSMVSKLNRYADKFIVSIILPAAAYAEYSIGAQEVPIIRVIPFAVGTVLISRYVSLELESKKEELLELWYKGVKKVSLLVIPLTILCIVTAPDIIALVAGSEHTSYQNAVIPFQIFNLIVLLRVTHYGSILQAFGDTKGVFYLSLNLIVANIILSVFFTIWWGIIGTAVGAFLANFYNWYITLKRIGGHMEVAPFKVLPMKYYLKVLATAVAVAMPIWFGRYYFFTGAQHILSFVLSIIFYLAIFILVGSTAGVISKKDRMDLKNWLSLKFLKY